MSNSPIRFRDIVLRLRERGIEADSGKMIVFWEEFDKEIYSMGVVKGKYEFVLDDEGKTIIKTFDA
jgi:hypothetical protein